MPQTRGSNRKVLVLAGDGIGPEIMRQALRVIEFFDRRQIASFEVTEGLVGGAAYDKAGVPLTDQTLAQAAASDAVLFGAVGGAKWDALPFELRPERGILRLRKEMDLFANLRPAVVFDALADASSLKPELVAGLDLMIVRELTGGIYFGAPRGIETLPDGSRRGVNTEVYSEAEGSMPREPVSIAAQSDRMSPKRLLVTITSNCLGLRTSCIAQLSAYIKLSSTSG